MAGTGGRSWKRILLWVIGIAVVLFIVIQFIPYGRSSHSNPTATNPFQWADPQAEAIAAQSCYDCHSNETEWWWATNIAPFSWLVQRDVDQGRANMNFSEFAGVPSAEEFAEVVNSGEMPPFQYTIIHRDAKLTDAEKQVLIAGYTAGLTESGASSETSPEPAPSATATPAATATAASGDAVAVIGQRCGSCHSADQALSFRAGSKAEAQALIDSMVQRGAQVTPEEEQVLAQYFVQ
jgi:mono/diheme cytochrome c family protein